MAVLYKVIKLLLEPVRSDGAVHKVVQNYTVYIIILYKISRGQIIKARLSGPQEGLI